MRLKELPKSSAQIQMEKLLVEVEQLKTALIQKDNTIQSLQNQLTSQANTAIKNSNQLAVQKQALDSKKLECDTLAKTITAKDLIISEKQNIINELQKRLETKTQLIQDHHVHDQLNADLYLLQNLRIDDLEKQVIKLELALNFQNYNNNRSYSTPPLPKTKLATNDFVFEESNRRKKLDADLKEFQKEFENKISPLLSNNGETGRFTKNGSKKFNDFTDSNLKNFNIAPKIKDLCKKIEHGINSYEYILEESDMENSYTELMGNSDDN